MRIREARGDWAPRTRIDGLRRYAFIGDSFTYGQGVAPDETLPAHAERLMNEMSPAWAVEAVNFGICGYNLWNSWFAFKSAAQVFAGVVIVLCNNDADMFNRAFKIQYEHPRDGLWEAAHPFGRAVADCFDDIAAFGRENELPVAVCYYNVFEDRACLRIGAIIADLCAARGLAFIDTLPYLRGRHFQPREMVVSGADSHPSALVHEAAGRFVAESLRRQGWFGGAEDGEIQLAPERILAAASEMIAVDAYPPEAAYGWGLRALEAKMTVARRLHALRPDDDGFALAAARARDELAAAHQGWHITQRARAFMGDVAAGGYGMSAGIWAAEEFSLRLDELAQVLKLREWRAVAPSLAGAFGSVPGWDFAPALDCFGLDFSALREALDWLLAHVPEPRGGAFAELCGLADRVEKMCGALADSVRRFAGAFADARAGIPAHETEILAGLVVPGLQTVLERLDFLQRWPAKIKHLCDPDAAAFTTLDVTIRRALGGPEICWISAQAEYHVPHRLWFSDTGKFMADGTAHLVSLYVPLFYGGRLRLSPWAQANDNQAIEADIMQVEIYNRPGERRMVTRADWQADGLGGYLSPVIYLS
jgi:hypothetical protein